MTRSLAADSAIPDKAMSASDVPMDHQVNCDVDRIIDGLDYDSFELLPGTVNPRPGMRYIDEDISDLNPIEDSLDPTEESLEFNTEDTIDDLSASVAYLLPSPAPYWHPFLVDNRLVEGGKKKKKNKKKRNKNRQRQLQEVSPPATPDISDGGADSPLNSPSKSLAKVELSPEKKAKKKRNKQRRRGSGRARRLAYPNYEGIDLMSVHLNGLTFGTGMYAKPEAYSVRSPNGPSYLNSGPVFSHGSPLWVPHPVIYSQC